MEKKNKKRPKTWHDGMMVSKRPGIAVIKKYHHRIFIAHFTGVTNLLSGTCQRHVKDMSI